MASHVRGDAPRILLLIAAALFFNLDVAHAKPDDDLLAAIDKGELDKAERALKKKANPEARGNKGATALMLASEQGRVEIAKLLLGAGAKIETTREGGIAAIHHAAGGGQIETLKLLLASGANVSTRTDSGLTPLVAAGRTGKIEVLQALLDAGADPAEKDNNGMTAFMTTAQSQCVPCLQLFRSTVENINAQTAKGFSVLDYAVPSRSSDVWKYLFEQGAGFDAAKSAKDNALFSFIADPADLLYKRPAPNPEIFGVLVAHGANLEAKYERGQTPLILAAERGDLSAVKALIDAKANINARDKDEASALMRAASRNVIDTAKMFVAIGEGASMQQAFRPAEKSDKSEATATRLAITRALLEAGADVKAKDKDGYTALHKATQLGDVEMVGLLLAAGADVNAQNKNGFTALMSASTWNYHQCASALLAAGADAKLATSDGRTALSIAKNGKHAETLKLLEAAGK